MTELHLGPRLRSLTGRCETFCVAGCCGLEAFDFHPIHLASGLLCFLDVPRLEVLAEVEQELVDLEQRMQDVPPDEYGDVCFIESLNTSFSLESWREWAAEFRTQLRAAVALLDR